VNFSLTACSVADLGSIDSAAEIALAHLEGDSPARRLFVAATMATAAERTRRDTGYGPRIHELDSLFADGVTAAEARSATMYLIAYIGHFRDETRRSDAERATWADLLAQIAGNRDERESDTLTLGTFPGVW
jgi:hypothetical protein